MNNKLTYIELKCPRCNSEIVYLNLQQKNDTICTCVICREEVATLISNKAIRIGNKLVLQVELKIT